MRHFVKYDLVPLLSMAVICAFPCIFMYARNASEVEASEMVPFLLVFLASAAILFLVTLPFFRNASRAAFWTDLAMLVIINFCLVAEFIKRGIPFLRERYQLVIILLLLAALFVLLLKKKPDIRTGCLLLLIGFGAMTLINFAVSVPAVIAKQRIHREFSESPTPKEYVISDVTFPNPDRPNVYWFLFDEYGGYDNLLHYYNYDNSPFLTELEDRGFVISNTSRNTEGIFTSTIVTNLLNLNYLVEETDEAEEKAMLRNNCQMYQLFAANGYRINLVNHVDFLGTDGCRVLTSNQAHRTISVYLLRNCLYDRIPLIRGFLTYYFISDYGASYRAGLDNAMEAGLSCWREAEKNDCPTLTVGYYQFPKMTLYTTHFEDADYIRKITPKTEAKDRNLGDEIRASYQYRRNGELDKGIVEESELQSISDTNYDNQTEKTLYPLDIAFKTKDRKSCPYVKGS